jgi:CLIP-associating protein 1/2
VGGSYRKIHDAATGIVHSHIDSPSARDPLHPASAPASIHDGGQPSIAIAESISGNGIGPSTTFQPIVDVDVGKERLNMAISQEAEDTINNKIICIGYPTNGAQGSKKIILSMDKSGKKNLTTDSSMDKGEKKTFKLDLQNEKTKVANISTNGVNGSQRPYMGHHESGRSSDSSSSLEDNHLAGAMNSYADILSYMDGLMSLNDALTEGLGPSADWSSRVVAFTYLIKLLQQGPKGYQEVAQNFEQVMKLLSAHLDDPHWKVAQSALSALIELVPPCRRLFEPYLERTLPSVFARLVDTKIVILKLSSLALETIGNTYNIDSLLLPLLRSLDEQRTPKAKIAVIEFAIAAFAKLAIDGCRACPIGLLKLWLGKLTPLANDKNPRLKEVAISGIISVYSNFESIVVLNFILGLPIEEQSILRRSLKQFTPHIDLDLMAYLQNKCQRPRIKCTHDHAHAHSFVGTDGETTGMVLSTLSSNNTTMRGYSGIPTLADGGCNWFNNKHENMSNLHDLEQQLPHANDYCRDVSLDMEPTRNFGESSSYNKAKEMCNGVCGSSESSTHWSEQEQINLQSMSNEYHNIQSKNKIALEQQGGNVTNMEAKRPDNAHADVPKTYAEIHLHQEKEYEFPTPQQTSPHVLDVSNQVCNFS